eukprot:1184142-Prorocentrum_minimum.AAC.2
MPSVGTARLAFEPAQCYCYIAHSFARMLCTFWEAFPPVPLAMPVPSAPGTSCTPSCDAAKFVTCWGGESTHKVSDRADNC